MSSHISDAGPGDESIGVGPCIVTLCSATAAVVMGLDALVWAGLGLRAAVVGAAVLGVTAFLLRHVAVDGLLAVAHRRGARHLRERKAAAQIRALYDLHLARGR